MFGSLCPELHSLGLFLCADANLTEQQSDTLYSYSPSNDQPIGQEIGSSIPQLFPNLQSLNFGTSPILHSEATLAGILCQYIGGDVRISSGPSRNISNSTPNTYIGRLGLGGKVPDPIPDHLNDKNEGADKRAKLWSLDANGEPLVDDYAVVVGENGEPLSLGLEFMTPDEFGVKRFPGVFIMRERSKIRSQMHAESTKWGKVAKMLPLAARISEQERRRVERLDC
ncbi:hypothetical protein BDN72DRAFT_498504 [Pluteus cervinus]|uniref:Uncharacterized protein n=1 Tax=Pluteus cervinus TaxID=181527 RepID=A0ACD3A501_9AGAR|nr:hypothetical protein BDN72DRAFT_498504 [Pluteus cervinus]